MIFAAVGDTGYNVVLLLHILTMMVAFAPVFVHPVLGGQSREFDAANRGKLLGFISGNGRRIYAPALIVTGLLGFALSGMSSDVYELSQGWLLTSALLWIVLNGVLHAVVLPNERKLADGDATAEKMVKAGGSAVTLILVMMLYLMIFKPGL